MLWTLLLSVHHGWSMGRVGSGSITISVGRPQNLDSRATLARGMDRNSNPACFIKAVRTERSINSVTSTLATASPTRRLLTATFVD